MNIATTKRIDKFYNRSKFNLYDYLISGQTDVSYFVTRDVFYKSLEEISNEKEKQILAEESITTNRIIMYSINQACTEDIINIDDVIYGIINRFMRREYTDNISITIVMVKSFFKALVEQKVLEEFQEDLLYKVL